MKKLDDLFKKVEFFEKLATYGNRSSFLQSIAKMEVSDDLMNLFLQARGLLKKAGLEGSKAESLLSNAILYKNVDLNDVISELDKVRHSAPPSLANAAAMSQLNTIIGSIVDFNKNHGSVNFEDLPPAPGGLAPRNPSTTSSTSNSNEASWTGLSIGPEIQAALNKMLFLDGTDKALELDGKLGPKTQAALQAFKKKYNAEKMDDSRASQYAWLMAKDDRHF